MGVGIKHRRYRGRLESVEGTPVDLVVDLRVGKGIVELLSEGQTLGDWPISGVSVSRSDSDTFLLNLGGEAAVFAADDVLTFTYEGVPLIAREAHRWRYRMSLATQAAKDPDTAPGSALAAIQTQKTRLPRSVVLGSSVARKWGRLAVAGVAIFLRRGWVIVIWVGRKVDQLTSRGIKAVRATIRSAWLRVDTWRRRRDQASGESGAPIRRRIRATAAWRLLPIVSQRTSGHRHRYVHERLVGDLTRSWCPDCGETRIDLATPATRQESDDSPPDESDALSK